MNKPKLRRDEDGAHYEEIEGERIEGDDDGDRTYKADTKPLLAVSKIEELCRELKDSLDKE